MGRVIAPSEMTKARAEELGRCFRSYTYFINNYCKIYDSVNLAWIPFTLWPEQERVLHDMHTNQLTVILKARQLGISWLALCYGLWGVLFQPIASVSIFSRRDTESMYLMGSERMRGVYDNLPLWMRSGHKATTDSGHEWVLGTGSAVRAFSTNSGDGYVATFAIIDEADLQPDLNKLLRSVKPTIDNGGKMVVLSRVNKSEPESEFKQIYRGAKSGENGWHPVFLPWNAHPERNEAWYERQRKDILSRTGSLDDLYEQYPASDVQALSSKTLDKRIPALWLESCYVEMRPIHTRSHPGIPNLDIYFAPKPGVKYVMGADPAEGNPNSDDSALTVIEMATGEEVALLAGKFEPAVFASYISQVSAYYNNAPVLVERNNHGHSVIQWLEEHARRTRMLLGHDAETYKRDSKSKKRRKKMKFGWLSSTLGKTILYTVVTEHFRDNSGYTEDEKPNLKVIHSFSTFTQLSNIEAATLSAPKGQYDDRADSYALAQAGRKQIRDAGETGILVMDSMRGW